MRETNSPQGLPEGPVLVTRRVHFCAAHRLHNPDEEAAWNQEAYGPCNNPQWHGHNYELEVTVSGEPDERTGYVIDLKELKDILEEKILRPCDHMNLNEQVPFLEGVNPTAENLVKAFWAEIEPALNNDQRRLQSVRLLETPRNIAEYRGPGGF
jgi:6-pyruvoyltetrahydropterin/6-carboxytetrahydropterin synthase